LKYPLLKSNIKIGVTAPSSGVDMELHSLIDESKKAMESRGYHLSIGKTVWTQNKAKSDFATIRANELMSMLLDNEIGAIIPPWGGELMLEVLEYLDFNNFPEKWILGYSDISGLNLAITLRTGIATATGPNLVDLRGSQMDSVTGMWNEVLGTKFGDSIIQYSSSEFQESWDHSNPSPCIFHLTEKTEWKTISGKNEKIKGRILGGCIDIIRHLIGTPYGQVNEFRRKFTNQEPVIWYFENCELTAADLKRTLTQMKYAGWFEDCLGILFGRSAVDIPTGNYCNLDVYNDLANELAIPMIYDIDQGHVPPQITMINGSFAEIHVEDGRGTVIQHFI